MLFSLPRRCLMTRRKYTGYSANSFGHSRWLAPGHKTPARRGRPSEAEDTGAAGNTKQGRNNPRKRVININFVICHTALYLWILKGTLGPVHSDFKWPKGAARRLGMTAGVMEIRTCFFRRYPAIQFCSRSSKRTTWTNGNCWKIVPKRRSKCRKKSNCSKRILSLNSGCWRWLLDVYGTSIGLS